MGSQLTPASRRPFVPPSSRSVPRPIINTLFASLFSCFLDSFLLSFFNLFIFACSGFLSTFHSGIFCQINVQVFIFFPLSEKKTYFDTSFSPLRLGASVHTHLDKKLVSPPISKIFLVFLSRTNFEDFDWGKNSLFTRNIFQNFYLLFTQVYFYVLEKICAEYICSFNLKNILILIGYVFIPRSFCGCSKYFVFSYFYFESFVGEDFLFCICILHIAYLHFSAISRLIPLTNLPFFEP